MDSLEELQPAIPQLATDGFRVDIRQARSIDSFEELFLRLLLHINNNDVDDRTAVT